MMSRPLCLLGIVLGVSLPHISSSECRKKPCIPGEVVDFNGCCVRSVPKKKRRKPAPDRLLRVFPQGTIMVAELDLTRVRGSRAFSALLQLMDTERDLKKAVALLKSVGGVDLARDLDAAAVGFTEFDDHHMYLAFRGRFKDKRVLAWLEKIAKEKAVRMSHRGFAYHRVDDAAVVFLGRGRVVICEHNKASKVIDAQKGRSAANSSALRRALASAGRGKAARFAMVTPPRLGGELKELLQGVRWASGAVAFPKGGVVLSATAQTSNASAGHRLSDVVKGLAKQARKDRAVAQLELLPLFENISTRVKRRQALMSARMSASEFNAAIDAAVKAAR